MGTCVRVTDRMGTCVRVAVQTSGDLLVGSVADEGESYLSTAVCGVLHGRSSHRF